MSEAGSWAKLERGWKPYMLLAHCIKGTHHVIAFGDTRPIFACLSVFSCFSCSLFGFQHSKCRQIACLQTKVQGQKACTEPLNF